MDAMQNKQTTTPTTFSSCFDLRMADTTKAQTVKSLPVFASLVLDVVDEKTRRHASCCKKWEECFKIY